MIEASFTGNIERFTGFAEHYDAFRPSPPAALAPLLQQLGQCPRPQLVVDLGSGTGLSTRYWIGKAEQVIGIEPTEAMRQHAISVGGDSISYREGFSHATGLADGCADIVTCSQALHWMDPQPTFREVARLLRPGGVFAAFDHDWPPATTSPETDAVYIECDTHVRQLEESLGLKTQLAFWNDGDHLAHMKESRQFTMVRECLLHHINDGDAERLIGFFVSQGNVQTLQKHGLSEEELGIDRLRETAGRLLGPIRQPWFWSYRVRLAIK